MSTLRAPSTASVKLASSPPQRAGSVWVRGPRGHGQGSAHVCHLHPCLVLGSLGQGTAATEPLLTKGLCKGDKMKTIIMFVQSTQASFCSQTDPIDIY